MEHDTAIPHDDDNRDDALKSFRDQIDQIDEHILQLVNRRIELARSIGHIKSTLKQPAYYRPEREAQVLRRLQELNSGPLEDNAVESLFREIMSITRGTEAGLTTAVLGPAGTFSESAARHHFGSAMHINCHSTIDEVFRTVEQGQADFAVVPIENSVEGGVSATYDCLLTTPLSICGEVFLPIHHNLLAKQEDVSEIEVIYAHTQALGQCRRWLDQHLPRVHRVAVASNAEAAKRASLEDGAAAIASDVAADIYGLSVLRENIEDQADNTTRFLVLSRRQTPISGNDKTCLLLSCRNRPGALFHLLSPLLEHNLDMSKIESRPSKIGLWEYVFFIDLRGHQDDEIVGKALADIKSEAGLFKNLGSFPAAL